MTATLIYPPVRDGYQFTPGYGIVETKLDGGQSRRRLDIDADSHLIQATWVLRSVEYTDFMGFFRTTLKRGTLDFLVDLVSDIGSLTLHRARCVGGLPRLTQNQGDGYTVQATLEVDQNPTFTTIVDFTYIDPALEHILVGAFTPPLMAGFLVGDQIRIINAIPSPSNPAFNFDGTYTVSAKPTSGDLELSGARFLNTAWGVIHNSPFTLISCTVTRIPT